MSVLTHPPSQLGRQLDREHHGRFRDGNSPTTSSPLGIPAGLPDRAAEPPCQHPGNLGHRHAGLHQLGSSVDPLSTLHIAHTTTTSHAISILLNMSLTVRDTPRPFQPPVAQRDVEAEVAHCVGGVLTPLLANVALSVLDDYLAEHWQANSGTTYQRTKRRRAGLANYKLVRYADDFVVLVSGTQAHAHALREEVAAVLAPMGLRLSKAKTKVCHIDEGFDFLGFHIQRRHKRGTAKRVVYTYPSKKALASIIGRVRALTSRSSHPTLAVLLRQLNPVLQGWCTYFRYGVSKATFGYLDQYTWHRVVRWLRKRHPRTKWAALMRRHLPGWQPTEDGVTLFDPQKGTVSRYRYRATNIPAPWARTTPGPTV